MENFLTNILSSVFGTGFLIIFYIIQIGKSLKVKSAKGISWIGWTMLNLALLCMFISSVAVFVKFGTYGYMITETANVGLALVELVLILKYRKNDKLAELQSKQTPITKNEIGFQMANAKVE